MIYTLSVLRIDGVGFLVNTSITGRGTFLVLSSWPFKLRFVEHLINLPIIQGGVPSVGLFVEGEGVSDKGKIVLLCLVSFFSYFPTLLFNVLLGRAAFQHQRTVVLCHSRQLLEHLLQSSYTRRYTFGIESSFVLTDK